MHILFIVESVAARKNLHLPCDIDMISKERIDLCTEREIDEKRAG